jgi:serine/threonine protein kinase
MSKNYLYEDKIGSGFEGNIYKVTNKKDLKYYALKDIKKEKLKNIDTFRTSSEYQKELNHSNVAKIKEIVEDDENIVIVLELCDEDLSSLLKRKKLSSEEKKYIFKQIVLGLKYIHSKNIIHRDIKPHNILMCKKIPKITDFGLAKKVDPRLKYIKGIAGTPRYISPEIVQNEPYTFPTDIWSLGVLFYQIIYGKEFLSELKNKDEILDAIKSKNIPELEGDNKGRDLLKKMLNKNQNERITLDEILKHPYFRS